MYIFICIIYIHMDFWKRPCMLALCRFCICFVWVFLLCISFPGFHRFEALTAQLKQTLTQCGSLSVRTKFTCRMAGWRERERDRWWGGRCFFEICSLILVICLYWHHWSWWTSAELAFAIYPKHDKRACSLQHWPCLPCRPCRILGTHLPQVVALVCRKANWCCTSLTESFPGPSGNKIVQEVWE